jgi:hypothetical protein
MKCLRPFQKSTFSLSHEKTLLNYVLYPYRDPVLSFTLPKSFIAYLIQNIQESFACENLFRLS